MRRAITIWFVLLIGAVALTGCGGSDSSKQAEEKKSADKGSFKLEFTKAKTADERAAAKLVTPEVTRIVKELNERVVLPKDIPVIFTSDKAVSEKGPFFSPGPLFVVNGKKGRLIAFPYDFITYAKSALAQSGLSGKALDEAAVATTTQALVHEASHALINIFQLPVLGREEDAADAGSAVFLTGLKDGGMIVKSAVRFWKARADQLGIDVSDLADEHGLNEQRAYNLLCWVYGSDVNAHSDLKRTIPGDRSARCSAEYTQLASSWDELLEEHVRK